MVDPRALLKRYFAAVISDDIDVGLRCAFYEMSTEELAFFDGLARELSTEGWVAPLLPSEYGRKYCG